MCCVEDCSSIAGSSCLVLYVLNYYDFFLSTTRSGLNLGSSNIEGSVKRACIGDECNTDQPVALCC